MIRPAEERDLPAVVAVFLGCWRESYSAVLGTATIDRIDEAEAERIWRDAFARSGEGAMLVADRGAGPVGVTRWRRGSSDTGRIESLYVAPAEQGRGTGGLLLAAAEAGLRDEGATVAELSVFAENGPAIAFYAAHGWADTGARRTDPRFGEAEATLRKDLR